MEYFLPEKMLIYNKGSGITNDLLLHILFNV